MVFGIYHSCVVMLFVLIKKPWMQLGESRRRHGHGSNDNKPGEEDSSKRPVDDVAIKDEPFVVCS